MSATKILWGQISVVFLIILATTWGATQYVAWSLAYQAQLGTGGEGGAIWLLTRRNPPGSISINGNTFASNTATNLFMGEQGGAIAVIPDSDQVVISNNVMAFNSSGIYKRSAMPLNPTLVNNQLWNWTGGLNKNYVNVPIGPTDLQSDPQFVDRVNGNYRLAATSPAIEAGSDCGAVLEDLLVRMAKRAS